MSPRDVRRGRRVILVVCTVVGAVVGATLLSANDNGTTPATTQAAHGGAHVLAVVAESIFGAVGGWALGSVALFVLSVRRQRD